MAETPENEAQGDKQPEAAQLGLSSRLPVIMVSLAALAVIGAATANSLPSFNRFALPSFDRVALPDFNHFVVPDFNRFPWPNFSRFAAKSPNETVSVPIPDPVSAALKEIQLSQQQNAAVLVSLAESSATQQADLKRISRQLSSLAARADALQSAMPLTTSSIPHSSIPRSNIRARVFRASRKIIPQLPKPVGPVSVGGAPLSPAATPRSGA